MSHNEQPSIIMDEQLHKPDFDKTNADQDHRYDNLMSVVSILNAYAFFHESSQVSDWPNASIKSWRLPVNKPDGFKDKVDSVHKLLMVKQSKLKKREFMPNMAWRQNYGAWKATRCNIFACDFSMAYLPNKAIPWASQWKRAHEIYEILPNSEDCIELNWSKAWDYINAGFPVYFVAPKKSEAGHIAIGYPSIEINSKAEAKDHGYIVQAGSTCGKKLVSQGFNLVLPEEEGGEAEDDEIKIYMYVGHLGI